MNRQTAIDLVGFKSVRKYQKDYDIFKKFMSYHQAKISGHLPQNLSLSDEEQQSFRLLEKQFSIMSHEEIEQFCKQVERRHAHMRKVELRQSAANQSTGINIVDMYQSHVEHIGSKTTADSLVANQATTLEGSLANMTSVVGRTVESAGTKASGIVATAAAETVQQNITGTVSIPCSTGFADGFVGTFTSTTNNGFDYYSGYSGGGSGSGQNYTNCTHGLSSYGSTDKITINVTGSATASYTDFYYDNYESYNTYFRCYYSNGYLHVSWYGDWNNEDGSGRTDYSGILSLTAKGGAIVNYTVTFDPNGGYRTSGGDLVQTIPSGHSATPPYLMRAGHTYIWRGSYTNITSNRTITAIWTPTKRFVSRRTQKELPFGCSSGSGSVNTNSGRFSFVHKDVTVGAGSYLLGVAHMYNSHFAHDARTSDINTYLGAGWKLDIHQYVKEVGDDLHYIDAAGNVNVFVRVSVHNVDGTAMEYTYRDVLGSGTRIYIQKNIPTPLYRLVDEVGNQMTFDVNGRLTEIESAINSSINKTIVYDSLGRPTALYDSRKTDRIIHFIYAQDNLLNYITTTQGNSEKHRITCIYDSAGRLVQLDETLQNVTGALNKASKTLTKFTYDVFGNMQCIYNAEDKSGLYLSSSIELWTMSLQSGAVTNTDNPTSGFATKSKVSFSAVGDYYTAVTNDKGVTMNYELDDDGNCVSVYETSGSVVSSVMPSPEGKRFFDTTTASNSVNSTRLHAITQGVGYTQANGMNHYALTSLSSTEKKNINDYLADNKTKYVMFGAWVYVKQNSFSSSEKASVFVRLSNGLELKESYYYIPINQAKVGRWQYVTATTKIKDHLFAEENCQVGIAKFDNGIGFDVNIADLRMMALPGGTFFRQNSTNLYDLTSIVVNDSITIDLTQTGTRLGDNFITEEDVESMLYSRFNDTAFFTFFYNNKTKFVGRVSTLKFVAGNWSYTVNSLTGVATVDEPIVYSETTIGSTQVKKHRVYSSGQYTDYIKYKLVFTNITDTKTYKRDGRLLETIDEYGVVTHYHYDVNGNLLTKLAVSSDSKLKMIQIFTYNGNDEMTSYTDDFGITHTLATNANSQPFSLTKSVTNNAGGDTTSFEYDQWLRKTSISEAGGGAVGTNSFIYNSANKLSAVSDGGALYGVQYNAFGDISSISEGGNTLFNRTYTYGPNNTVSTVFGNEPSYSYEQTFDKYGRITSIGKTNASANVEQITEWQYKDPHSSRASSSARLSKILDNSSDRETSYSYDINGNYSEYQVKDGGNALYGMCSIPIDSLRNKSYGLNIGLAEYFYGITYDGNILINPRVESVFDDSTGVTTTPEYDSMGRLYRLKRVDSNYAKAFYIEEYSYKDSLLGSAYTTSVIHKVFTYNDVDYIKELTHDITYDANGNVTGINNADAYTYDRLGRLLTESSNGVVTSYAYDTRGNIKTKTVAGNRTTFSYSDGDNKLTEIANIGTEAIAKYIRYDVCGYPVKYKVSDAVVADNMTWLRGNLTQYRGNGADSNYRYDVNGIRTHKQCGTKSSTMINDGGKLMAEIRSDIGQVYYAYDTLGLSGIRYKDSDSSSNPYGRFMVRQDCLGNISEIYLIGNGSRTKVAKYSYTALGECKLTAYAYTNGLSEVIAVDDARHVVNVNPFRWKGYYYDAESGLYYVNGRYYDPETGRFIDPLSPETINLLSIGGLNLYGLGEPNPLMFLANRYNCFPSLPLVFDGSESGSSGWNLPTWARIMIGTLAIIGSVALGGIPALIGVGVGAVVGAGFEMGGQAIFEGGIHDWGAVGWSAFGGASAGGIGAMVLGAGYGATYLLGGAGSVTGGLVSGNVNGFSSAVLHFGIGGFLNMGGKWVGDKVANAINSRIAAKATDFVANSLFMDMMGEAWEIAGYQAMNQATQSVVNTATTQILHANGYWVNSLAYIIINQIISSFISGIY